MKTHPLDTLPMPHAHEPASANTTGASRQALLWFAVFMLAASTFLNYMDRQALALLARPIQAELAMDDRAYSHVVNAFMVAYMLGNVFAGLVIDRFGVFRALPIFVGVWSLAGAAAGLVDSSFQLGLARFMLGLFETGNFIAAPIIVSMLLHARHTALGVGIYTAAAMLGAAASPPLVTWIDQVLGWRQAFVVVGGAGLLWVAVWLRAKWRSNSTKVVCS
jgi:ACS family hexuronate transporter-like MFS transporter